jgi:site-specific DNA recombinase
LAIEFGISKYYVDKLSEDIRRGIRQKLKNGIWPQQAPVGYLNDHKTKTIVVDPVKAPLIRKAYEMYATGEYTLRQVRVAVNNLGFSGKHSGVLSTSNYQYLLQNPVYYGLIRYHGEYYDGKHEPIISKALFECVQAVMANKSKLKSDKRKPYLYRGLFRCGECGRLITTETQKGHNYLRCTKWEVRCSQPYVREERVEEEITDAVRSFALPTEWTDWMLGEAHALESAEADEAKGQIESLRNRLMAAGEQLDRLMTAYTHGVLSLSEYRDAKNKLVAERRQVEEHLIAIERNRSSAFEPLKTFLNATKQAGILAETGTNEQKRDFLKNATSNLTISDRHLSVSPREAWELVVNQGRLAQQNAAPFFRDAAFAGETDQHFQQRRGGDSNSRDGLSRLQHFQCCSFSHSDTSPENRGGPSWIGGKLRSSRNLLRKARRHAGTEEIQKRRLAVIFTSCLHQVVFLPLPTVSSLPHDPANHRGGRRRTGPGPNVGRPNRPGFRSIHRRQRQLRHRPLRRKHAQGHLRPPCGRAAPVAGRLDQMGSLLGRRTLRAAGSSR